MKIVHHPTVRILVIMACAFVSFGLIRSLWDTWRRGDQVAQRRAVLKQEQEKNTMLAKQLEEATSSAFVEREARNKLGLAKDGETIVLMGAPASGDIQPQNVSQAPLSRWRLWWKLFF